MKKIKKLIAYIFDIPNAMRVLDIMDNAGCSFDFTEVGSKYAWKIISPYLVTKKEADDLRKIVQFKYNYKKRGCIFRLYKKILHLRADEHRILTRWYLNEDSIFYGE